MHYNDPEVDIRFNTHASAWVSTAVKPRQLTDPNNTCKTSSNKYSGGSVQSGMCRILEDKLHVKRVSSRFRNLMIQIRLVI